MNTDWNVKCETCGKEIVRPGPAVRDFCSRYCQSVSQIKEVNDALERERQDEEDKDWYLRNDTWIKDIENSETSAIAELHGWTNRDGVKEYAIVRWWYGRATVKLRFKGEIVEENL